MNRTKKRRRHKRQRKKKAFPTREQLQAKALRFAEWKQQILEAVDQVIHKKSYAAAIEENEPEYHESDFRLQEVLDECDRQEVKFLGILSCAIVVFLIVMICIDLMR